VSEPKKEDAPDFLSGCLEPLASMFSMAYMAVVCSILWYKMFILYYECPTNEFPNREKLFKLVCWFAEVIIGLFAMINEHLIDIKRAVQAKSRNTNS